jgi:hypothetical protein
MGNFVNPNNKVVASGTPNIQVLTVTGTVTECKPGRLVKAGTADDECAIGTAAGDAIGFLGYEQTYATYKPDDIDTAYEAGDMATVINGPGIHVIAEGSEAINKGDRVAAAADGKVAVFADGTMTPDMIVGVAEETISSAGAIRIRSLI